MGPKGSISLSFRIIYINFLHNQSSWSIENFSSINVLDLVNFTYEQCLKLETRQIKNVNDGNFLQLGKCTHLEDVVYWVTITWHFISLANGHGIRQKGLWKWGGGDSWGCLYIRIKIIRVRSKIMTRIRHRVSLYSEEDASIKFHT